jgi:hypothetical protein
VVLHVADRELGALALKLAEQHAGRLAQQIAQHLHSGRYLASALAAQVVVFTLPGGACNNIIGMS